VRGMPEQIAVDQDRRHVLRDGLLHARSHEQPLRKRIEVLRADPSATAGEFHAAMRAPEPGVYRVAATARRGATSLGSATATLLVGGVDVEMTDPRLNEETLQRVAHASGGAVIARGDLKSLLARLESGAPAAIAATRKDLWHAGWSFAMLAGLLAAEWLLRRASGLR